MKSKSLQGKDHHVQYCKEHRFYPRTPKSVFVLPTNSGGMLIKEMNISLVLKLNFQQNFNLNRGLQEEGDQIPSSTTHSPILMCFVTMVVIDELLALIMSHEIL